MSQEKFDYTETLTEYRTRVLGYSTRELAEQIGVDGSYIRQIETGKVKPSLKYLYKMYTLGLSTDALFAKTNISEILSEKP